MKVLDELREQMRELVPTLGHVLPTSGFGKLVTLRALAVFRVLDSFEAAHPGLIDMTVTCRVCGGKMSAATVENDGEVAAVVWGNCPACAKEAK